MATRLTLFRLLAIPSIALGLLVGAMAHQPAPIASAQCIGLQTGSDYCIGESAHNGGAADAGDVATDPTGRFVLSAPHGPADANSYNGYGPMTYPYYGASGYLKEYSDNMFCFPC